MDGGLFWNFPDALGKQMIARAAQALLCATGLLLILGDVARADQSPERVESLHYEVAKDYSYKFTMAIDSFVQKQVQVKDASQLAMTYDPRNVAFRFVGGWVEDPNGAHHKPATDAIFTRPSAASRDAPGFVSSVTTTVVMP